MCCFQNRNLSIFSCLLSFSLIISIFLIFNSPVQASETSQEEMMKKLLSMSLEELIEVEVSIATKSPMPVRKAPAIAEVISAEQIRMMGARRLVDVLERVVGIGVNRIQYSVYSLEIRGLKSIRQNKIKFMVDGHAVNVPTTGDPAWYIEDIALEQIERVEIIRGPGSALYGANAFAGIINVITKTGEGINGTQVSGGGGSFDTGKVNILYGKTYGNDVDVMASLSYNTTQGAQLDVESDAIGQSGQTDDWAKVWDGTLKVGWKEFVLESRYSQRNNGPYVGVANILNNDSELESETFFTDLSYTRPINTQWNVNARAYYDYADISFAWQIFPPGMAFSPLPVHYFPEGVYGTPGYKNKVYGAEIGSDYKIIQNNTVTVGAVYEYSDQYDLTHHTNFNPLTFENLGSYQDISAWGNWNIPADRTNIAVYIQDEWNIIENVTLTAGLRYDDYDDVGSSTNPRLGLVWGLNNDIDLKLLYGEAFRVPTFDELYSINNPASVGNPDLKPEEMKTYEISLGYNPEKGISLVASGFHNEYTDKIDLVPTTVPGMLMFQNTGDITIYGIELDARYNFDKFEVYGNYYWNHAEGDTTGDDLAEVPSTRWNVGLNFLVSDWGKGNLHLLYVGDAQRATGDMREDHDAYTVVNTNFIVMNFLDTLELSASVYNIFDKDYSYPAPAMTLANDYPAVGRSFFLEARYTF